VAVLWDSIQFQQTRKATGYHNSLDAGKGEIIPEMINECAKFSLEN
jgi:hypothetical protein